MGIKPTIEMMPQRTLSVPTRGNAVMVATPPQMVTVPAPLATPMTIWGARRQARYYDASAVNNLDYWVRIVGPTSPLNVPLVVSGNGSLFSTSTGQAYSQLLLAVNYNTIAYV